MMYLFFYLIFSMFFMVGVIVDSYDDIVEVTETPIKRKLLIWFLLVFSGIIIPCFLGIYFSRQSLMNRP